MVLQRKLQIRKIHAMLFDWLLSILSFRNFTILFHPRLEISTNFPRNFRENSSELLEWSDGKFDEIWQKIRFHVFDLPALRIPYEERRKMLISAKFPRILYQLPEVRRTKLCCTIQLPQNHLKIIPKFMEISRKFRGNFVPICSALKVSSMKICCNLSLT